MPREVLTQRSVGYCCDRTKIYKLVYVNKEDIHIVVGTKKFYTAVLVQRRVSYMLLCWNKGVIYCCDGTKKCFIILCWNEDLYVNKEDLCINVGKKP